MERVSFYHCDQIGTPQALSNELGESVWEITLNTWGKAFDIKTINESNPFEQSNIRFQGQYYDKETGLHYNRYRYYDPHSSRYMSKDPIGLEGGLNTSAYVSNPTQWVDPMGLQPVGGKKSGLGLGILLPNTMSAFAKKPEDARTLRSLGAIRNNKLKAVAVAGYGPYAVAGTVEGAPVAINAYKTASQVTQVGIKSGGIAGGLDLAAQAKSSVQCHCNDFNPKRTVGVGVVGMAGGVWGANMAKAAGVEYVSVLNLKENLKNIPGLVIFVNQKVGTQAGARAVKEASNGNKKE